MPRPKTGNDFGYPALVGSSNFQQELPYLSTALWIRGCSKQAQPGAKVPPYSSTSTVAVVNSVINVPKAQRGAVTSLWKQAITSKLHLVALLHWFIDACESGSYFLRPTLSAQTNLTLSSLRSTLCRPFLLPTTVQPYLLLCQTLKETYFKVQS